MAEDIDLRTEQYILVRDRLKQLDDEHTKKRAPLLDLQEKLAGRIRKVLEASNVDSMKTKSGTCYLTTRYSASVADGELFMNFVKAGNWDLIERRANPTVVKDYVKQHNCLPAGVNLSAVQTLGVRRPTKSKQGLVSSPDPDDPTDPPPTE